MTRTSFYSNTNLQEGFGQLINRYFGGINKQQKPARTSLSNDSITARPSFSRSPSWSSPTLQRSPSGHSPTPPPRPNQGPTKPYTPKPCSSPRPPASQCLEVLNKTNLTAMREGGFSDSLELYQRQVKTTAMIQAERVQAIAPQDMIEFSRTHPKLELSLSLRGARPLPKPAHITHPATEVHDPKSAPVMFRSAMKQPGSTQPRTLNRIVFHEGEALRHLYETFGSEEYDRRRPPSESIDVSAIRDELDYFKENEMAVHPDSEGNTLIYRYNYERRVLYERKKALFLQQQAIKNRLEALYQHRDELITKSKYDASTQVALEGEVSMMTELLERLTLPNTTLDEKLSICSFEELTGMAPYIDIDEEDTDSEDEYDYLPN